VEFIFYTYILVRKGTLSVKVPNLSGIDEDNIITCTVCLSNVQSHYKWWMIKAILNQIKLGIKCRLLQVINLTERPCCVSIFEVTFYMDDNLTCTKMEIWLVRCNIITFIMNVIILMKYYSMNIFIHIFVKRNSWLINSCIGLLEAKIQLFTLREM